MLRIIAGLFKNRVLKVPKKSETRPTSGRLRETVFNILQQEIEGAHFLDLFAGSGAIGLEALSRGALSATFVDSSRECITCIEENIALLGVKEKSRLFCLDAFQAIKRFSEKKEQFDLIFVDPPYETFSLVEGEKVSLGIRILLEIDRLSLLKPNGTLFIEESKRAMENRALQTLTLKKARDSGKTTLWQFVVKEA